MKQIHDDDLTDEQIIARLERWVESDDACYALPDDIGWQMIRLISITRGAMEDAEYWKHRALGKNP